jgi:hypothetical protein
MSVSYNLKNLKYFLDEWEKNPYQLSRRASNQMLKAKFDQTNTTK